MARCPKCDKHLRLIDWRQTCPHCGVNLVYYKSNEKLLDDSEKAEIEHAHTQPKIDRGKAAYFGSKLAVTRFVLTILPVVTLLIPFAKIFQGKYVNLVSIVNFFRSGGADLLLGSLPGDKLGLSLALLLLSAAMFLVNAIFIIASYGKHGKGRMTFLYAFTFLLAVASFVFFMLGREGTGTFSRMAIAPGAFVYLAAQLAALIVNIVLYKRGVKVKYTQCLIGGLPGDEYFKYVEDGMTREEIRRKMLVALAGLQEEYEKTHAGEDAAAREVNGDVG